MANPYWVSAAGEAEWAAAQSATALAGAACCSLATANANVAAGDTVYLRAGTYNISGSGIDPAASGSSGNPITYEGYQTEEVNLVGAGATCIAVDLDSDSGTVRSYIKVTKINCSSFYKHLWILKGEHNEISYCTFDGMYDDTTIEWRGSTVYRAAKHNWIHHCVFKEYGSAYGPNDNSVVFELGNEAASPGDDTSHNLVEECEFYWGGHHVCGLNGNHNVFRNNYVHNEAWWSGEGGTWGNRSLFLIGQDGYDERNLLEWNRIGFGGECADAEIGGSGGTLASRWNIIRRNQFYQTLLHALVIKRYAGQGTAIKNYLYHNTMWHCGHSTTGPEKDYWNNVYSHGLLIEESADYCKDNRVKNNLFHDSKNTVSALRSIVNASGDVPALQVLAGNRLDAGDPGFVDITSALNPLSDALPDLRLTAGSGAIDAGVFLTTITSDTGSGTSFVVDDAGYFHDGWTLAAGIDGSGVVAGDEIQLEGTASSVTVTDVDYDTNTITVDTEVSWTQGDGVALAFDGSAPDQGYYEYPEAAGTLTVAYSGNGAASGEPPTDANTYSENDPVTVAAQGTLAKYTYWAFIGWNTAADGSGTAYQPGATMTMPAENVTLYAQWRIKCALIAG